jgi:uncharacterized protein YbjT (DUF2867 family)
MGYNLLLTGYIGGSVVARLLEHHDSNTFEITALVRSAEKATKIKTLGIGTTVGSYSDLDKLEKLTSEADVIFSIVREPKGHCDYLTASYLSSLPGRLR